MEDKLKRQVDCKIDEVLDEGINVNNIEGLYKLVKIKCMMKEDENMYNDYGRRYEPYGNYNEYGRRGYDTKYRGNEYLDSAYNEYNKYEEYKRYGHSEDTKRSLKYMLESMENFARMLKEDAKSPEEVDMIRQTAQRIAQM